MQRLEQHRRSIAGIFIAAGFACSAVDAVAAGFENLFYTVDHFSAAAVAGYANADVDGDGIRDIVFGARTGQRDVLIVAGKRSDGSLGLKQLLLMPAGTDLARAVAWHHHETTEVVATGNSGVSHVFSGWPLALQRSFATTPGAVMATIADVDNDGTDDLVVLSPNSLATYSMNTGAIVRSLPLSNSGHRDLAVAQLDGDPALEIILGGSAPGLVVDGATNAIDWSYIDGFGAKVVAGRFGDRGAYQWVGAHSWYRYTMFRSTPWSPLWTETTPQNIGAIAAISRDLDGRDDIAIGHGQSGSVQIIDSITRQVRLSVPNPGHGVRAIDSGDIDGDEVPELVFAPSGDSYYPSIAVANAMTGSLIWSFTPMPMPLTRTAIGDVDGDGRPELVSLGHQQGEATYLVVSDFVSGVEKWRDPIGTSSLLDAAMVSLKLAAKPNGAGMNIVLGGQKNDRAGFLVVDGVTKDISTHDGQLMTGTTLGRRIGDIDLFDYDDDGILDIVTMSNAMTTAASGSLLHVFSGRDGTPLWISPLLSASFEPAHGGMVVGISGPSPELVALLSNELRAFDAATGELNWTLVSGCDGAVVMKDVVDGEVVEAIAVYRNNGSVRIYSAQTRALLRSFELPPPLTSIIALDHPAGALLATSNGALALVDGINGAVLAMTEDLGELISRAGAFRASDSVWYVAAGADAALHRKRLVLDERIFSNAFEAGD